MENVSKLAQTGPALFFDLLKQSHILNPTESLFSLEEEKNIYLGCLRTCFLSCRALKPDQTFHSLKKNVNRSILCRSETSLDATCDSNVLSSESVCSFSPHLGSKKYSVCPAIEIFELLEVLTE